MYYHRWWVPSKELWQSIQSIKLYKKTYVMHSNYLVALVRQTNATLHWDSSTSKRGSLGVAWSLVTIAKATKARKTRTEARRYTCNDLFQTVTECVQRYKVIDVDCSEDSDQAGPGLEGVVVEQGEARRDCKRHKVLESPHRCVDLSQVCGWNQLRHQRPDRHGGLRGWSTVYEVLW